ncbi:MAG TPA: FHA domain-containing protein [Acidobacteriota bacterium]|nr:FHA domain-containing protein [Acidobacteriota bacterium]
MTVGYEILEDGTLKLDPPADLPEVLDLLIVGGGPAGTAAALRARERGMTALVIDRDDIMSRIRDYSKDKLIYPNYGGEDTMRFPKGGELVSQLPFAPIDKDELCSSWKSLYLKHAIPARVGLELMGVEPDASEPGVWKASLYSHKLKREEELRARHVVLAIGRGVPRTFDIPGNTMGIHYRLADAEDFVEGPVCVVGGGTSAAEAVIAISRAKIKAGDETAIYWSYRGEKMPRVSKALNEEFFEAFVLNGNIRYCPRSEPAAVLTGDDHQEYLAIRTDRRKIEGRPSEAVHLEFPKERCIACIGEDIPEKFLDGMGIRMAAPGGKKKFMVVDPVLQSEQAGVYMIGDILSQYYLCAEPPSPEAEDLERRRHPGNIKSAVRDGVFIADVVYDRLQGGSGKSVQVEDAEEEAGAKPFVSPVEGGDDDYDDNVRPAADEPAWLIRVQPGGIEDARFGVRGSGPTTIGRSDCDIELPDDPLVSQQHASITRTAEGFLLRDDGSTNGVFLMLDPDQEREVFKGDLIAIGQHFLLFGDREGGFYVGVYDSKGQMLERCDLEDGEIVLVGRQGPDIIPDKDDHTLSRRHLKILVREGQVFVRDLYSSNGSALRIRESVLGHQDRFRIGQSQFIFALKDAPPKKKEKKKLVSSTQPGVETAPERPPEEVTVTVDGQSYSMAGKTLLEVAEEHDLDIEASCRNGTCGIDPVKIVSGQEYLNPCDEDEAATLQQNGLKCGRHRYACKARAHGPIVVELMD